LQCGASFTHSFEALPLYPFSTNTATSGLRHPTLFCQK
jgi:hypothetical protein